jgi:membrane protein implicated in regulation of membrane protease activity
VARDPRKRRVFFWLAIAWAALFYLRLAVQLPFYFAGDVTTLGTLKLVMGLPLFAPLVAVTWLAVRAVYPRRTRPTRHPRRDRFILTSR